MDLGGGSSWVVDGWGGLLGAGRGSWGLMGLPEAGGGWCGLGVLVGGLAGAAGACWETRSQKPGPRLSPSERALSDMGLSDRLQTVGAGPWLRGGGAGPHIACDTIGNPPTHLGSLCCVCVSTPGPQHAAGHGFGGSLTQAPPWTPAAETLHRAGE